MTRKIGPRGTKADSLCLTDVGEFIVTGSLEACAYNGI